MSGPEVAAPAASPSEVASAHVAELLQLRARVSDLESACRLHDERASRHADELREAHEVLAETRKACRAWEAQAADRLQALEQSQSRIRGLEVSIAAAEKRATTAEASARACINDGMHGLSDVDFWRNACARAAKLTDGWRRAEPHPHLLDAVRAAHSAAIAPGLLAELKSVAQLDQECVVLQTLQVGSGAQALAAQRYVVATDHGGLTISLPKAAAE
jgi:hypothetical protein